MHLRFRASSWVLILASLMSTAAHPTPPVGGMPSLDEVLARGCRQADVVVVARVASYVAIPDSHGELRIATIEPLQRIKGRADQVPRQVNAHAPMPPPTDSEPVFLYQGLRYLMFLRASSATQWVEIMGEKRFEDFEAVVRRAQEVCRSEAQAATS